MIKHDQRSRSRVYFWGVDANWYMIPVASFDKRVFLNDATGILTLGAFSSTFCRKFAMDVYISGKFWCAIFKSFQMLNSVTTCKMEKRRSFFAVDEPRQGLGRFCRARTSFPDYHTFLLAVLWLVCVHMGLVSYALGDYRLRVVSLEWRLICDALTI